MRKKCFCGSILSTLEYYNNKNSVAKMKRCFEQILIISNDFEFLAGYFLFEMSVETFETCAPDLSIKYDNDIVPEIYLKYRFKISR